MPRSTHDAEVVVYTGPDEEFQGREIMFGYNTRGNTLTIVDMTDHNNPAIIGADTYEDAAYTHQGWLTEDQTHLFLDDEADERRGDWGGNTRTMTVRPSKGFFALPRSLTRWAFFCRQWDVSDLRNPRLVHEFYSTETVIDHNQ